MSVAQLPQPASPPQEPDQQVSERAPTPFGWWSREVILAGTVFAGLCLLEGWLYLRSYYAFFHIPTEGLDVSAQEVLFQGAHSILFPLIVVPVAFFLHLYARRMFLLGVLAVTGCAAVLAFVASALRWYSAMDIMVQTAAVLWIGLAVLAVQRGFGGDSPLQRLLLAGAALLLLVSMPTAFGTIDAGQKATSKKTHFSMVSTHELGLPDATRAGSVDPTKPGNLVEYRKFVLLRETGSRYWVMRLGRATDVYSVAKSEVLYIRY